ncbi:MAG: GNAT family N-acetyltransferase [Gemmatimonadaceae bacterium]
MTANLQPTLQGELIELRPLRLDDWDALFAVASDRLIWEQHPASDRYQEPVFREFFRVAMESHGAFAVIERATGHVIGSSRYAGYDPAKRELEIGWTFLARSHWGGRYNGEMKRLMMQHAFQFVDRALFVIGRSNVRSRTAIERLGGVVLPDAGNGDEEKVVYAISAPCRT